MEATSDAKECLSEINPKNCLGSFCWEIRKTTVYNRNYVYIYCCFLSKHECWLGCDIGGAKEQGVIYIPTNWGAKEPQNVPNHRVVGSNIVLQEKTRR